MFLDLQLLRGFAGGLQNQSITWRTPELNEKSIQVQA
jgi:hypothetical protein